MPYLEVLGHTNKSVLKEPCVFSRWFDESPSKASSGQKLFTLGTQVAYARPTGSALRRCLHGGYWTAVRALLGSLFWRVLAISGS